MTQFLREIQEQPQALSQTAAYYGQSAGEKALAGVVELWMSRRFSDILITGMGSSYFIATAMASLLGARGIPAFAVNAGELLHDQCPQITSERLLICISQSGESYEVVRLLDELPSGVTVVSICNEADSTLAKRSDITLLCKAGKEEKTSTKTFITCYQVAYLLAMRLCSQTVDGSLWPILSSVIERMTDGHTPWMPKALQLMGDSAFVQTIGRGAVFATASQCALMFMEATHTPASALLGGEFRHGPLEMVKKGFVAIVFAHSQSATFGQSRTLVNDILKFGGKVIFVTDSAETSCHERLCVVNVPCPEADLFAIPAVVPVQLLIDTWAVQHGIVPGEFTHGAKVTAIE